MESTADLLIVDKNTTLQYGIDIGNHAKFLDEIKYVQCSICGISCRKENKVFFNVLEAHSSKILTFPIKVNS